MRTVGVLLTCHNRIKTTLDCLDCLFKCVIPKDYKLDVYLVDDGSTDETAKAVQNKFSNVNIIQGDGNLFWNQGMRLAWETAVKKLEYDFYLWLNDDTKLFKDALKQMLEYSNSIENTRIIIGATCSSTNSKKETYGGFNLPKKKLKTNGQWQDCDYFNGNIVLIPAYIYRKVGLLDKRFKHTLGDFDYGIRACKLGFIHSLSPFCLGFCEDHESDPIWRNPKYPLNKRFNHLYTPLGNNPIEFFSYDRRHFGLIRAIMHFMTIHLRTAFPILWKI